MLRLTLHPQGLAPAFLNLGEGRHHLLDCLRRLVMMSVDPVLDVLQQELAAYPTRPDENEPGGFESPMPDVVNLFRLRSPVGELASFSTITVFGTPTDITFSELTLEPFVPADTATAERLRSLAW